MSTIPENIDFVVCDGPPGTTRGGRRGLLPILGKKLLAGCEILLDDADRDGEQEVLENWQKNFGVSYEVLDKEHRLARVWTKTSNT